MVIRAASARIQATVKAFGQIKEGDYGPYQSVLFERGDRSGEEAKVWKSMKPEDAKQFQKGQQVILVPTERKGKPTWDIELMDDPMEPAAPTERLSDEQKRAIAKHIDKLGPIYGYCWKVAEQQMGERAENVVSQCAAALFAATVQRFDL